MARKFKLHHDSLGAMVDYIKATPRDWESEDSRTSRASSDWDLGLGYEGALKLAAEGWTEGASRMSEALATLPAMESVSRTSWGVAGGSVSVGRYCAGNPLHMRTRKREFGHKPAVTLAVSVVANCSVNANHMSNYGLAIARYSDQLEQAGYPVEVIAVMGVRQDSGNRTSHTWTVKEQGHAMNLADIAFSIGHPACFRRLGFAALERSSMPRCYGYGYADNATAADLPERYRDAIILNGIQDAHYHSRTPESALAALSETIDAILAKREAQYH